MITLLIIRLVIYNGLVGLIVYGLFVFYNMIHLMCVVLDIDSRIDPLHLRGELTLPMVGSLAVPWRLLTGMRGWFSLLIFVSSFSKFFKERKSKDGFRTM